MWQISYPPANGARQSNYSSLINSQLIIIILQIWQLLYRQNHLIKVKFTDIMAWCFWSFNTCVIWYYSIFIFLNLLVNIELGESLPFLLKMLCYSRLIFIIAHDHFGSNCLCTQILPQGKVGKKQTLICLISQTKLFQLNFFNYIEFWPI